MNTANQECIWKDQCGGECLGHCPGYTPAGKSNKHKSLYFRILKENVEEYQKMINDYSDGEADY
ncbi:hypothetical protein D3Z52_02595 [Clostridiaceae bacterium]|nr:hypothetical protein [Clostridiaceae bacterium]